MHKSLTQADYGTDLNNHITNITYLSFVLFSVSSPILKVCKSGIGNREFVLGVKLVNI